MRASNARLAWAAGIVLLAAAAAASSEAVGRSARRGFDPPPEFGGKRWAVVPDAAEAVRAWMAAGVHGRPLVVLTGRWGRPASPAQPALVVARPQSGDSPDLLDADSALFAAARLGVAREMHVAMPPAALALRLAEARGAKDARVGDGWASHPYHGYPRRFSSPAALRAPPDPALVLVEPSFLEAAGPAAIDAWLRDRGVIIDLGIVALDDPAASDAQRERARALAEALGAVAVEVEVER